MDEEGDQNIPPDDDDVGSPSAADKTSALSTLFGSIPNGNDPKPSQDPSIPDSPDSGLLTQEDIPLNALQMGQNMGNEKEGETSSSNDEEGSSDDASDSSDDDDDDSSSTSSQASTLLERRRRNDQRNARFLSYLDSKYEKLLPSRGNANDTNASAADDDSAVDDDIPLEIGAPRGMKFSSPETIENVAELTQESILKRYPFRESQIRMLSAILATATSQKHIKSQPAFAPPPIFIMGGPGTGKSSVVKDVVEFYGKKSNVSTAYLNVATMEPSSIDQLVSRAYIQLKSVEDTVDEGSSSKPKRKRKRKIKRTAKEHTKAQRMGALSAGRSSMSKHKRGEEDDDDDDDLGKSSLMEDDKPVRRFQPGRSVKLDGPDKSSGNHNEDTKEGLKSLASAAEQTTEKKNSYWASRHAAVVSLGRALRSDFGREGGRSGILVIDHGDRLLSLSAKKGQDEPTNYLAELLLLSKVMDLNLTVIVVSNNCLLDNSRLNNIVSSSKSFATLSNGVHPLRIKFPAYRGADTFKEILRVPDVLRLVTGEQVDSAHVSNSFQSKVLDAFLKTLSQALSGSTRDIREFIRLGRSFWPLYTDPIHPDRIDETVRVLQKPDGSQTQLDGVELERKIVAHLDRKILPRISASLNDGLFSLSLDSPYMPTTTQGKAGLGSGNICAQDQLGEQPYFRSCLLLAAFICQNNKADKDKKIFGKKSNGRRKKNSRTEQVMEEELAFGSSATEEQQLKQIRPRPFPADRMFSIFTTLVGLNATKSSLLDHYRTRDEMLRSLESSYLDQSVSNLIDMGFLHRATFSGVQRTEQIGLNKSRFWCSLTREEADRLAKSADIPLDAYLV